MRCRAHYVRTVSATVAASDGLINNGNSIFIPSADSTAAVLSESRPVLLVAPSRRINRRELASALDTLRRLEVPCAGVVLSDAEPRDTLTR